ncbi:MAG: hypothetical protein NC319_04315 [Butyricicoccus sp.]|nr:hypothetical protein [Butyricicoccus sp.]
MLVFKEGRLYAGRSSFAIPDGFRVNDRPNVFLSNGIMLSMPDEAISVDVNFEYSENGAEEGLRESLAEFTVSKMKARSFDGGTGWCAESRGDLYAYLEVRFDAPTGIANAHGDPVNTFRVVATAPYDTNIRALRKSPEMAGLLNSFRP